MNSRDELAEVIRATDEANDWDTSPEMYGRYSDAILAAGYVKPRTITSVEELKALSAGSIIRDRGKDPLEKIPGMNGDYWAYGEVPVMEVPLPATVLWEPK